MKTIPGAASSLDPPGLVGNSAEISLIPRLPTVDDKVSLRIKDEFPASNAVIRVLSGTSSGRLIVVDPGPTDPSMSIAYLDAGTYHECLWPDAERPSF